MNRGMTVLTTWRLLLGDKTPTDEEYYDAIVLAWCVEFVRRNCEKIKSLFQRLSSENIISVVLASGVFPCRR
jgi:tRNA(Phe) wybutosine-synthesizing methylase Tyw3